MIRITAILLSIILVSVAHAQEAGEATAPVPQAPLPAEPAKADGGALAQKVLLHLERAYQSFEGGRYDACAGELELVYKLEPQPIYLFNIAQSYRRAGKYRPALSVYKRFLAEEPGTPLRIETQGYIRDTIVLIEKQDQIERERHKPTWKKAWFWGVLAGGVAVVGIGLGTGLSFALRDTRPVISYR